MKCSIFMVSLIWYCLFVGCGGTQTVQESPDERPSAEVPTLEDAQCPEQVWEGDFQAESSGDLSRLEGVTKIAGSLSLVSRGADGEEEDEPRCDTIHICTLSGLSCLREIDGSLRIAENHLGLVDLHGLDRLTRVGGTLTVEQNSVLVNLEGLGALRSAGGLVFSENERLTTLDGLGSLESTGFLRITAHDALSTLEGLSSLRVVEHDVSIERNALLTSLDGLSSLTTIGGTLELLSNHELSTLDGLEGLSEIGGYISFAYNRHLPRCAAEAFIQRMSASGWSGESEILSNEDSEICTE